MPKAAQGSAKSPTAGGSARTKNSRRGARPADPDPVDGGGSAASEAEATRSTGPDATTTRTRTEAVKTGTNGTEKEAEAKPAPAQGAADKEAAEESATAKSGTAESGTAEPTTAKTGDAEDAGTKAGDAKPADPKTGAPKTADPKTGNATPRNTRTATAPGVPKSGGSPKTSALTRTTPLRQNAVGRDGTTARARPRPQPQPRTRTRTRTRSTEPKVSLARRIARRVPRWWPLPLCLALGAGAGAVYSAVTPAQYAATSYVVVSPAEGRSEAAGALGYAQAYGKIATDPMILADAEKRAGLRPGTIRDGVQASTSPDAPMVQITATSSKASQAAENADAVAKALTHTAKTSTKRTGARLTVLSEAMAPPTPVSPSSTVAVSVGACAGGLLGGLVLLVRPPSRRRPATAGAPASGSAGAPAGRGSADGTVGSRTAAGTEQAR